MGRRKVARMREEKRRRAVVRIQAGEGVRRVGVGGWVRGGLLPGYRLVRGVRRVGVGG